ncbi:MAG TPA: fibrobacter succinogenes major paralogous domain-containing protein, partial [Tenuifilaceae bacterium]|nr:fibrobacter succinogenes major paralogous domain-containing protein [Tenuifilaceae bacterium]
MKKITSTIFLLLALWLGVLGQTPPAFYYQASLRTDDGTAMVNQAADFQVELRQGSSSGELVYAETHSASTDAQGVIALTIGGGTATLGDFGAVPWDQSIFVLVSIKLPDSDDFAPLGENEIHAVPYSVFAAQGNEGPEGEAGETGVGIEWLGMLDSAPDAPELNQAYYNSVEAQSFIFDGAEWQVLSKDGLTAENGEPGSSIEWLGMFETAPAEPVLNQAYFNATEGNSYIFDGTQWSPLASKGEVGTTTELPVGTAGNFIAHDGTDWVPTGRIRNSDNSVVVSREEASATDAPIFAVYNSAGQLVFAVHQGGTRVYVSESAKAGSKGGFAVGGLTQSKGEMSYLTIMPDSVRFGIVEGAKSGSKGGFAVGGLTQNKYTPTQTYLSMAFDSVRFTVADNELKGSKGGFAVGGLTQSKEDPTDLFNLNADTTYIATTIAAQSDVVAQAAVTVAGQIVTAPVKDIDGNIYSTVDIGPQRWMAENLKVTRYRDGTPIVENLTQGTTIGAYSIYDYTLIPEITTDSAMNAMYGKLYNSYAATSSLGLCPAGWVVPSIDDWDALVDYLGGQPIAGGLLKSIRTAPMAHPRWDAPNASASNLSGFKALPGGDYSSNGFGGIGSVANFWTKTYSELFGSYFNLTFDIAEVIDMEAERFFGFSVRCIKTDAMPPKINTNPVTDIGYIVAKGGGTLTDDGGAAIDSIGIVWASFENPTLESHLGKAFAEPTQTNFAITIDMLEESSVYYVRAFAANKAGVSYGKSVAFTTQGLLGCGTIEHLGENYQTIQIGDQCWMRENLRATTFRGGEPLESATWTDIENVGGYWDESTDNLSYSVEHYGYTYNWAAAKNDNICPVGWYMPEASDWQILIDYLDGEMVAGGKLKGIRIYDAMNPDNQPYWYEPNQSATNESGFSAYPAGTAWPGNKGKMGTYFGEHAYFWSKTEGADMGAFLLQLTSSS